MYSAILTTRQAIHPYHDGPQETAEYYWQRYCYTKDLDWLRDISDFIKGRPSSIALIPALLKRMMENIIFITPICTSNLGRAKTLLMTCPWQEACSRRLSRLLELLGVDESCALCGLTAGTIWLLSASPTRRGIGQVPQMSL